MTETIENHVEITLHDLLNIAALRHVARKATRDESPLLAGVHVRNESPAETIWCEATNSVAMARRMVLARAAAPDIEWDATVSSDDLKHSCAAFMARADTDDPQLAPVFCTFVRDNEDEPAGINLTLGRHKRSLFGDEPPLAMFYVRSVSTAPYPDLLGLEARALKESLSDEPVSYSSTRLAEITLATGMKDAVIRLSTFGAKHAVRVELDRDDQWWGLLMPVRSDRDEES